MFIKYQDISSRESYEYYKKNRKSVAKGINQYNLFRKRVEGLFNLIANKLTETEHGICIRDLGYFCILRTEHKVKKDVPIYHKSILRSKRRDYNYKPIWFQDVMYNGWYMHNSFAPSVYKRISYSSLEYKIHKILCEGMIVAEDFAEKATSKSYRSTHVRRNKYKKEDRK